MVWIARICQKSTGFGEKVIEIWAIFGLSLVIYKGNLKISKKFGSNSKIPKMRHAKIADFEGRFWACWHRTSVRFYWCIRRKSSRSLHCGNKIAPKSGVNSLKNGPQNSRNRPRVLLHMKIFSLSKSAFLTLLTRTFGAILLRILAIQPELRPNTQ